VQQTLQFTAVASTTRLSFASGTAGCAGPVLDDVALADLG
jgi:hypothetical protein